MYDFESMTYEEKLKTFSRPLECTPWREKPIEWQEPVTAYAESNLEDTWYALKR